MHYRDLEITNIAFYMVERRAANYDNYMKEKEVNLWTETVSSGEVEKLLKFIRSWDRFFLGNVDTFQQLYREMIPHIQFLKDSSIDSVNLEDAKVEKSITYIFDKIAESLSSNYQSTDTSKILHTILPNLIVMWDRKIRAGIMKDVKKDWGTAYATTFLTKMQKEAKGAIATCMEEKNLGSATDAIREIEQLCRGHTLAKLLDQHNYVIFTRTTKFKEVLDWALEHGKITGVEQQRLFGKLP